MPDHPGKGRRRNSTIGSVDQKRRHCLQLGDSRVLHGGEGQGYGEVELVGATPAEGLILAGSLEFAVRSVEFEPGNGLALNAWNLGKQCHDVS